MDLGRATEITLMLNVVPMDDTDVATRVLADTARFPRANPDYVRARYNLSIAEATERVIIARRY